MDMQKIGCFLAELRKAQNLTQEELGEEIGVTNKTISRWENGNYLPPVEMLQILSKKYDISINEILSGERLDGESYKSKAEENIAIALTNSAFNVKDKQVFFKKKWEKDHRLEMIIEMLFLIAAAVLSAIYCKEICIVVSIVSLVWAFWINNRRAAYIERHIYDEKKTQSEHDSDSKSK